MVSEVLVFILHIGILLCSSILIITFVNSIPRVKLMLSKQMTTALMAVIVSIVSMASYSLNAPGVIGGIQLKAIDKPVVSVQAFGMASRQYEIEDQSDFMVINIVVVTQFPMRNIMQDVDSVWSRSKRH